MPAKDLIERDVTLKDIELISKENTDLYNQRQALTEELATEKGKVAELNKVIEAKEKEIVKYRRRAEHYEEMVYRLRVPENTEEEEETETVDGEEQLDFSMYTNKLKNMI